MWPHDGENSNNLLQEHHVPACNKCISFNENHYQYMAQLVHHAAIGHIHLNNGEFLWIEKSNIAINK